MGKTRKISKWMLNGLMFALMAVCLIPLVWVVRTAFIRQDLALDLFAVSVPVLDNFKRVLTAAPFFQYYGNTIFITAGSAGSTASADYIGWIRLCQNGFLWFQDFICHFPVSNDDCAGSADFTELQPDDKDGAYGYQNGNHAARFLLLPWEC